MTSWLSIAVAAACTRQVDKGDICHGELALEDTVDIRRHVTGSAHGAIAEQGRVADTSTKLLVRQVCSLYGARSEVPVVLQSFC
jgi:hypothetical protein